MGWGYLSIFFKRKNLARAVTFQRVLLIRMEKKDCSRTSSASPRCLFPGYVTRAPTDLRFVTSIQLFFSSFFHLSFLAFVPSNLIFQARP